MIVKYYLTAYPAVYGQFPQAIAQPIAAVAPAQREGKNDKQKKKKKKKPEVYASKNYIHFYFD